MTDTKHEDQDFLNKDILFPDSDEDIQFSQVIRRAKLKIILRNVITSVIISLVVISSLFLGTIQLNSLASDRTLREVWNFKAITGANIELGNYHLQSNLFSGGITFYSYKLIEGVPVKWANADYQYSILGSFSPQPGNYSPIQIKDSSKQFRLYDYQTAQRELVFYNPDLTYQMYINDLNLLKTKDKNAVAEIALSFDHSYTVDQIKKMLPDGVHAAWYWVDTSKGNQNDTLNGTLMPVPDTQVYGLPDKPEYIEQSEGVANDFLKAIDTGLKIKGRYYGEYKGISDYLRKTKEKPTAADVRIIGVVVTGNAQALQSLQSQPYIKAAVLGVTAER